MASFKKSFPVPGKTQDQIYTAIASGIDHFLSKTPLTNVEINRDENSKEVSFKSSMASGTLSVQNEQVSVEVSLSFLASAFKGKIDEGITKWIQKTFSA